MSSSDAQTKALRDADAREIIRRELHKNVMVLAGAGAGKTHALVERMVSAIRTGVADIDRMAAITFTRKAAGEMRGRFYLQLREARKCNTSVAEIARIDRALEGIDQCFIGTIHSFCGRLLRERPLEAGLAPDFDEIDDREESSLRREAWEAFVQERYGAEDSRLDELEDHGIIPADLYAFFGERCQNSDLPLKETRTQRPCLIPAAERIAGFVNEIAPLIPARPERRDKLMTAVRRARHFIDNHGVKTDRDAARLLTLFEGTMKVTQKHWVDPSSAKRIQDVTLPDLQQTVIEPALRQWRESAYRLVADFVDEAVAYYDHRRQQLGRVTFQDLLVRSAALLRDFPDVRIYFQRRFRTLFVDEFQDTDPVQAEILFYLAATDAAETDWKRIVPRPGSLFLVGDDKQSIYRFRRADVGVFRFVADRICETDGDVVRLNTSFRSLGTLCKWINVAFPAAFAQSAEPYQAEFEPLHEHREAGLDVHCVRTITIPKVYRNSRAEIARLDAARIARLISGALEGRTTLNQGGKEGSLDIKAVPGDFLILARTRGQLKVYADALEQRGIPFDIAGGARLGESEEVKAVVTMLRAIYVPNDPLPFVSYLRGPFVGFSDPDLYAWRQAGGRFAPGSPVPEDLNGALRARAEAAMDQLRQAEEDLTKLSPAAAFERILDRTGFLAYAAVNSGGGSSSRAGSLLRLLSLVRQFSSRGWGWGRIVEELQELVADSNYDAEEMTLEMGRRDVVRLMNLHQAKGLQARVVFLADPCDTSYAREPRRHVSRSADGAYLSMTVEKPKGGYGREVVAQPEEWDCDRDEEALYENAEETRLLYVAATRARNLLVVSRYAPKPEVGPWAPLCSALAGMPEVEDVDLQRISNSTRAAADFAGLREAARRKLAEASRASSVERTVSGAPTDEWDFEGREGRGREYGDVVHHLFECAVLGNVPAVSGPFIARLIEEAGLSSALASDAEDALDRLRTSDLWYELQRADRVHTEVPVGAPQEDGAVVRGVIDLVYRVNGAWKIVDYKTDAAKTAADVERLLLRYERQVQEYASYWRSITGDPVARASIWLAHGPVKVDQLTLF